MLQIKKLQFQLELTFDKIISLFTDFYTKPPEQHL